MTEKRSCKPMLIIPIIGLISSGYAENIQASSYAPYHVPCPESNLVREATRLSHAEQDWLSIRDKVTGPQLDAWLENSGLQGMDTHTFSNSSIRIGLAFSGGGYRAMLSGAGQLAALDSRTQNALESKHMGGLLQASSYIAGLSGGGWLVSSIVANNWTSVEELQASPALWQFSEPFEPSGLNLQQSISWFNSVREDILGKQDAGFNTTITDIWGRYLSAQLFSVNDHGRYLRWSQFRNADQLPNTSMPLPVLVTDGRSPDTDIISLNSTVYEITPFEMGSWDPKIRRFTDVEYLGSTLLDGRPTKNKCFKGYDNVGFLAGVSSSLFNSLLSSVEQTKNRFLSEIIRSLTHGMSSNLDVAIIEPNPFLSNSSETSDLRSFDLSLVDGGEDGQNIPFQPLIQPERDVDIIFAFDNSADTNDSSPIGPNWPAGYAMAASYERQFSPNGNGIAFPYVPDPETFVALGLNQQPTFFGCNVTNMTSLFEQNPYGNTTKYPPLIVYLANSPHSVYSNTSTFTLSYGNDQSASMIKNGYNTATQNNGTIDSDWRACTACAVVLREQQRRGQEPTEQCANCFSRYCWTGETKSISDLKGAPPRRPDGQSNFVH